VILGVSDSHDAGVAVVRDGEILAAINEERLTRHKMHSGVPLRGLAEIWSVAGLSPSDVTRVAVPGTVSAGTPPINNDFTDDKGRASVAQRIAESINALPAGGALSSSPLALAAHRALSKPLVAARLRRLESALADAGVRAPVVAYHHHDCHLASAYYTSGLDRALVISNDGFGDGECARVAIGDARRGLEVLATNSFFHSLGVYYNYVTLYCGFPKSHHAGKTTGLAAYGDPARTLQVFRDLIEWDERTGLYRNRGRLFRNAIRDVRARLAGASREDAAAGIQRHCEDVLSAMARYWVNRTGIRDVVLVGGVHANVKVNQRIAETVDLTSLFVFPNMGDGGLALGAAFLALAETSPDRAQPRTLPHVYLGETFSDAAIEAALSDGAAAFTRPPHLPSAIAAHLADGRIVARFDGAMEYGPRALGNRSILYQATDPGVNAWLNEQLRRTEFMPFAPVMRIEDAPAFLQRFDARTAHTAEFMTITYDVTDRCKREAPAVVHVDGTARPQVLRREVNPAYYDILTEYHRLTGLSVLVNTSFNMHEEPIVCTPSEALAAFTASNLDVLAAGPFLVRSPGAHPSLAGG
jgi:carbamoyltransferase